MPYDEPLPSSGARMALGLVLGFTACVDTSRLRLRLVEADAVEAPAWDAPTVVEAKDGLVTFPVTGPIDRATRIEAVRINGPASGDGSSSALSIEGASPTVLHAHVIGGRTSSSGEMAFIGVYLRAGAAPEIRESFIEGGSGARDSRLPHRRAAARATALAARFGPLTA